MTDQLNKITSPGSISGGSEDDDDAYQSSSGSAYEYLMGDDVTAQLAAAGPVGVAAAAAIISSKKRKRPHSFETNPSIRKRQQNRLLRKLRLTIDEFTTRVGQQAIVLVASPGKPNTVYKVFGAKPLENVIKNVRSMVMDELDAALANQAPPPVQDDPNLFELPPLVIDGIPTPVEKMTQAQLRAFIPLMLKYSTGRGKPGWGRESTRPPWWPEELPWANVRMDARTENEKHRVSWTHALRQIVINCYKYHGREDLMPAFCEEDEKANATNMANATSVANTTSTINTNVVEYSPTTTVLHTVTHQDGSLSIVEVDPDNPIITLPDGTTAHVQGMATLQSDGETIHTLTEDGVQNEIVDLNSVTEATINSEGQIILTGEDGQVSGVISVPTSAMYQTMVANIQHLHTNSDGTVCLTPLLQVPKLEQNGDNMETLTVTSGDLSGHSMLIQTSGTNAPQILQVLSLKDASVLTKAANRTTEIKVENNQ